MSSPREKPFCLPGREIADFAHGRPRRSGRDRCRARRGTRGRGRVAGGLLVASLVACGFDPEIGKSRSDPDGGAAREPDAAPPEVLLSCVREGGARLRLAFLELASGERVDTGLFDPQLDAPCAYRRAGDGRFRCLPETASGFLYFRDQGCTEPIAGVVNEEPLPGYFLETESTGSCEQSEFVREMLAPVQVSAGEKLYTDAGSGCSALQAPEASWFTVGPRLDPTDFVAATPARPGSDTRIAVTAYEGDDGSRDCDYGGALYDRQRDERCEPETGGDGVLRCLPVDATSVTDWYADAACTEPVEVGYGYSCQPRPAYGRRRDSQCAAGTRIFEIGDEVQTEERYREVAGECAALEPTTQTFYAVESEVPPAELALLDRAFASVGARLERVLITAADGFRIAAGTFRDSERGLLCDFETAADGALRCLPRPRSRLHEFYADPACETPVALAQVPACADPPAAYERRLGGGRTAIFGEGQVYEGQEVYHDTGASCVPITSEGWLYYLPGEQKSPSTFAAAERIQE